MYFVNGYLAVMTLESEKIKALILAHLQELLEDGDVTIWMVHSGVIPCSLGPTLGVGLGHMGKPCNKAQAQLLSNHCLGSDPLPATLGVAALAESRPAHSQSQHSGASSFACSGSALTTNVINIYLSDSVAAMLWAGGPLSVHSPFTGYLLQGYSKRGTQL